VLEVHAPSPGAQGAAALPRTRFAVVRGWKGVRSEKLELVTLADTAACGYEFALDESYFVYASDQDGHLVASQCSGTRKMVDADEDVHALGMGATPVDPRAGGAPAAQPAQSQPRPRGGCASCTIAPARDAGTIWLYAAPGLALGIARATYRRRSGSRS
jgi:hypothetical protein